MCVCVYFLKKEKEKKEAISIPHLMLRLSLGTKMGWPTHHTNELVDHSRNKVRGPIRTPRCSSPLCISVFSYLMRFLCFYMNFCFLLLFISVF